MMQSWIERAAGRTCLLVSGALMAGAVLSVWQRALDALAGRTVYSLAAFAATVLAGVLVGFSAAGWPCRKMRSPLTLAWLAFFFGACWLVFQLAAVKGVVGGWQRILMDTARTSDAALITLLKTAAFFFGLPAVLAGITGRVIVAAAAPSADSRGARGLSRLAIEGLLPFAVGYLLGAGVLVPLAGVEGATRWAALWFGGLAALGIALAGPRRAGVRCALAALAFALVVGLSIVLSPKKAASVLTEGVFSRLVHRDSGFAQGVPMFTHHSARQTVAVYEDPDYGFVFTLDGRPVLFGNRFHTARVLSGYIPLLVRPSCKKAAVVGDEAGLYLPCFLRAGVQDVACVGADRAVVNLSLAADSYAAGDDAAATARVQMGATLSRKGAYDILFLAGDPVWMRGAASAYSRPFFRRCRKALSADGICALHLDARALSAGRFASIAGAFAGEFPGTQVWCTGAYDWLLIGCGKEIKAPVDGMLGLMEKPAVFRDLARSGVLALPEVLSCMVCDGKGLAPWLQRTKGEPAWLTPWLAPRTTFEKEKTTLQPAALEGCRQWKAQWVLPGELDVDVYVSLLDKVGRTLAARVSAVNALSETAKGKGDAALDAARASAKVTPRDALLVQLAESLELEARRRIKIGDFKGGAKCYENLLSFSSEMARSYYGLAYCLRANGENEASYLNFARAVAAAPEQTGYRLELAQVALSIGEFAEADRQFQEALKREPENPEFLFRYAKGLAWKERPSKNMAQALKLAERACVLTRWRNTEYAYGLADLYMEAGRVLEGMGLKRRIKEGFKAGDSSAP